MMQHIKKQIIMIKYFLFILLFNNYFWNKIIILYILIKINKNCRLLPKKIKHIKGNLAATKKI